MINTDAFCHHKPDIKSYQLVHVHELCISYEGLRNREYSTQGNVHSAGILRMVSLCGATTTSGKNQSRYSHCFKSSPCSHTRGSQCCSATKMCKIFALNYEKSATSAYQQKITRNSQRSTSATEHTTLKVDQQ
jgi:hypothetical protein